MDALTRKLDLLVSNSLGAHSSSRIIPFCETFGGGHVATQCLIMSSAVTPIEQVDYIGGGQRN